MTLRTLLRSIVTAAAFVALTALAVAFAVSVPAVAPATADPASFSGARAMEHVRAIAQRPHPGGTADHRRVWVYIMSTLGRLGIETNFQAMTAVGSRYPSAGDVGNVVALIPGSQGGEGTRVVLLMAHYDAVPAGPGAGDDASGAAVLLEVARAIRSGPPVRNDIILLFTDGEEAGLLGAAAFVRGHPWASRIGVTLNFEARGTRGPSLMFETGPGNLDVARMLRRARGARATSLSTAVYRQLPNDTDLSEVALLARPALNFAFIGGAERYHTSEDDVAHLDAGSVQHHGNQALALARAFGNEPLPRPVTGDAVFFDLPLLGVIVYPESWAAALAALLLALVVVVIVRSRRADPRAMRAVMIGAGASLVAVILAAGTAILAAMAAERVHAAIGSGTPTFSGTYLAAVALLAFAAALAALVVGRRWAASPALHAGALLVWSVAALLAGALAPGVSFLFTWPAVLAALAAVAASVGARAWVARSLGWLAAVVTIFILAPTLYLMAGVALGLGVASAAVLGVMIAFGVFVLAPLAEDLIVPWRWFMPGVSAAAAAILFVLAAATLRHDEGNPTRSALVYAVDAVDSTAWLTGSAPAGRGRAFVRAAVAAVAAVPAAGDSAPAPRWLSPSFLVNGVARAPVTAVQAPRIRPLWTLEGQGERRVALQVRPAPGTLGLSFWLDGVTVRAAAVNGQPIDRTRYRQQGGTRWRLDYYAPADTGLTLELHVVTPDSVEMTAVARMAGLPALPGVTLPTRPAGVLASQNGDVTLVRTRVRF